MERCLIERSSKDVEYGMRKMLERYHLIINKLNDTSAYTSYETRERMKLIEEKEYLESYLRFFDIQSFEIKSEWLVFNIK